MQTRSRIASTLLSLAMVACQSTSGRPSASPAASRVLSTTACGTPVELVDTYLFAGGLGVQNGIESRLRANERVEIKVMWANRSAQPPRDMTIRAVAKGGQSGAFQLTAGWAPARPDATFPPNGTVTGYVSGIPTVPFGGCWEFSWIGGSASDKLMLRVSGP